MLRSTTHIKDKPTTTQTAKGARSVFSRGLRRFMLLSFLFAIGLVAACSSDEAAQLVGGGAGDEVATQQAQAGAIATLGNTSKSVIGGVGRSAGASLATGTLFKGLGLPFPVPPDPDPSSTFEEQLGDVLALLFKDGVKNGNIITFTPAAADLCNNILLGQVQALLALSGTQSCLDFYSHVTLALTQGGTDNDGTLDIKYDTHVLAKIGYSPASLFIELSLAQLKLIAEAMFAAGFIPNPELNDTFEGVIRTTFTELGEDHGTVNVSVEQEIKIVGAGDDFTLPATPKVIEFTADGPNGTLKGDLAVGALAEVFVIEDPTPPNQDRPVNLGLPGGASMNVNLTGTTLAVTNLGMGDASFTLDAVDSAAAPDFSWAFQTFGFTVDGSNDTITFDLDYDGDFALQDVFGLFSPTVGMNGTTAVDIPLGSEWTVKGSEFDSFFNADVPLIEVGSVSSSTTVTSSGDFGSGPVSFSAGTCFKLRPSFGFPLEQSFSC